MSDVLYMCNLHSYRYSTLLVSRNDTVHLNASFDTSLFPIFPRDTELQTVYTTLLHTHFITPEMSSAGAAAIPTAAHHLGMHDEKVYSMNSMTRMLTCASCQRLRL